MADKTNENLRTIEKAVVKLRNNLKRADLDYTVQASLNSTDPTKVKYAIQITPPADGLAPITMINEDPKLLLEQVKAATKDIDYTAVEIAYHKAQIEACHRTVQSHEERINALENPEPETPEEAPEAEIVEDTTDGKSEEK